MKVSSITTVLALAAAAMATATSNKNVIVSYADETPDSLIHEAIGAIKAAGGVITQEYTIIKEFAATAPKKVLDFVKTWGTEPDAVVEDDQSVSVSGHDL